MAIGGAEIIARQEKENIGRFILRLHLAAALFSGAALIPAAASARTVTYPQAAPAIRFEVPDDWTVAPADGGLQITSPDRNSIILAGMAKADRAGLAGWQKAAGQRMVDFGIKFDDKANPPNAPHPIAEDNPITPLIGSAREPKVKVGEMAPISSVPSMALLGKASDLSTAALEATGGSGAEAAGADKAEATAGEGAPDAAADKASAEKAAAEKAATGKAATGKAATGKAATGMAGAEKAEAGKPLRFASVVIRGASLAGKPMDVQFLNFGYSRDRWFLMQQASGPDDSRAGAIIKSVHAVR